jgi:cyanophycinase
VSRTTKLATIGVAAVALLSIASNGAVAQETGGLFEEPAAGPLVIVGGSLESSNEPVFLAILGLRFDGRPICVLPTTAANAGQVTDTLVSVFERYGGPGSAIGVTQLFTKPGRADKEKIARQLEGCGGFFFTDGDSGTVVNTLRPGGRSTLAEQAILRVHRRGGVITGSNAGAALMSETMIQGGTSDDALAYGIVDDQGTPGLWLQTGMGFFHGGLADQRNTNEGRTGRLLVALAGLPDADRGFGIDNDTALVIQSGRARVVGRSQVIVLEEVHAGSGRVKLDGARFRVLLLGNGDEYNLMNGIASVGARKEALRLDDVTPTEPAGPWVATGLPLYIVDLAVSAAKAGAFSSKGYRFTLSKESGFDARAWEIPDGKHVPHGFTAGWFQLDIQLDDSAPQ